MLCYFLTTGPRTSYSTSPCYALLSLLHRDGYKDRVNCQVSLILETFFAHPHLSKIGLHYYRQWQVIVIVFFFLSDTLWDGASVAEGILESMNMVIHADRPNSVFARFKSSVTVCNDMVVSVVAGRQRVLDTPDT